MGRITREVGRLTVLVEELLKLAQAEGDPSSREPVDFPLRDLVFALAEDSTLEAEAKGCRLTVTAEGPAVVRGERELIHRAVENVLRNAIRHARGDRRRGRTAAKRRHHDDQHPRPRARRPRGMSRDHLRAVLSRRERPEPRQRRQRVGAVDRARAVELHSGRIQVRTRSRGSVSRSNCLRLRPAGIGMGDNRDHVATNSSTLKALDIKAQGRAATLGTRPQGRTETRVSTSRRTAGASRRPLPRRRAAAAARPGPRD